MTELVNAIVTEAKHTEPFLGLPSALKNIFKVPFSAATADLQNIVTSKKVPKFLHKTLYHSELASKQVGKELLASCNAVAESMGSIWRYLHIIDPTVVVPPDADDKFDFTTLGRFDKYDVKLTARYWAQEMHTLLLEMDSACRLAIKQQSRLALCLFEVSPRETSVFGAHMVLLYTQKLQRDRKSDARAAYVEFAKVYATMMDKLDVPNLKDKVVTQSILYQSLEMTLDLVDNLEWLQRMLHTLPDTTMEVWYQQFALMGDWMNLIYVPWMKECAASGIFPDFDKHPFTIKKGPIETVAKAFSRPVFTKHEHIKFACSVLTDLFMDKDPTDAQQAQLDFICMERTGLTLLDWAVIFDMSLEYTPETQNTPSLVEGGADRASLMAKLKEAEDALKEFLRTRVNIDPNSAIYKNFLRYVGERYEDLMDTEESKEWDALVERKDRWFPNMAEKDFRHLVEYVISYFKLRDQLVEMEEATKKMKTERPRITRTILEDIVEWGERGEARRRVFLVEAQKRLGANFSVDKLTNYLDWFQDDGYRLQITNEERFKSDTEKLLGTRWSVIEPLLTYLEQLAEAARKTRELEEEFLGHRGRLTLRRNVWSILLFIIFGGMFIFTLMYLFFPLGGETNVSFPVNNTTGQPIAVPNNTSHSPLARSNAADIANVVSGAWSYIADSRVVKWFVKKGDERLERAGLVRFKWKRLFSGEFWTDEIFRGDETVVMTLMYGTVLFSLAWSSTKMIWALSSGLGNTIADGYFDHNFSQTWQRERRHITGTARNQWQLFILSIGQVMQYHADQANALATVGIQAVGWLPGGSYTRAITGGAERLAQRLAEGKRTTIEKVRRYALENDNGIDNDNNAPEFNRSRQQLQRAPPDREVIEGPRVLEVVEENEGDAEKTEEEEDEGTVVVWKPPTLPKGL